MTLKERLATPASALWVCFLLNLLNYVDRQIPYSLAEHLKTEFFLSDSQIGYLGSAFLLVYAMGAVPLGYLADRATRRRVLGGCAFLWSLATLGSALAPNFGTLLVMRALVGIGEAGYAAAAPALLAAHYPEEKRSRVFAFFFIAIPLGSALGYAAGGLLGQWIGWRAAFVLVSLPGFALVPLSLLLSEGSEESGVEGTRVLPTAEEWKRLFSNVVFWLIILGEAAVSFSLGAVSVFFPSHLSRTFGYSVAFAGMMAGGLMALPSLLGSIVGGRLAERAESHKAGSLLLVPALGSLIGAALAVPYFQLNSPWLAHPLMVVAVIAIFTYPGPVNAAIAQQAPPRLLATAFSIEILMIHMLGDAWSPALVGAISDHFQADGLAPGPALARALGIAMPVPLAISGMILLFGVAVTRRHFRNKKIPVQG